MSSKSSDRLLTAGYIVTNVFSAIGIIITNKWLFDIKNFKYGLTLTALHQFTVGLVLRVPEWLGYETGLPDNTERKQVPRNEVIKISAMNFSSLLFLTLSLVTNSVGFYQLTKLLVVPGLVAVQMAFYHKQFSNTVLLSLVVLTVGVGLGTVKDVAASLMGTVWSCGVIVASSFTVIRINNKMEQYQLNSIEFCKLISPWMGLFLISAAPLFDNYGLPFTFSNHPTPIFEYSDSSAIPLILLTCLLAVGVNLTGYAVLKYTSPVTFQVVGHVKTCTILFLGYFLFAKPLSDRELFGVLLAIAGLVAYSYFKNKDSQRKESGKESDIEAQESDDDYEDDYEDDNNNDDDDSNHDNN
eukprot:gb/GECH01009868.1/.p1 GENE.gb/GECH01009868.1/~~gb/GECH01009868.1/.p1  ORF type:complete len:355 (+),score=66.84 gb/GECH01009868.1/:1-1065(+)